jgi:hypothetical protein
MAASGTFVVRRALREEMNELTRAPKKKKAIGRGEDGTA